MFIRELLSNEALDQLALFGGNADEGQPNAITTSGARTNTLNLDFGRERLAPEAQSKEAAIADANRMRRIQQDP